MSGYTVYVCIASIFVVIIVIKILQKFIWVWDNSPACLVGKTAIVTGSNTGMGFVIAQDLAKRGAKVILACRNDIKGKAAQSQIIAATGNPNVLLYTLDLSSFASVRDFVQQVKSTVEELHILVNNAGALYLDNAKTSYGVNSVKQVNYLGPFLLTLLLLDLIKKSAPSRIVNFGSIMAHIVNVDSASLGNHSNKMLDYGQSKLLNIMFTNELACRLKGSGVTANSVIPGDTYTNITKNLPEYIQIPGVAFRKLFFKPVEMGAQTPIYASVSNDLEGVTGKYFDNCREAWFPPIPKIAQDLGLRKEIFMKSLNLVELNTTEINQINNMFPNFKL